MTRHNFRVPLEIKSMHEREFEGHAAIFGNVDLGGDVVIPGAFKRSLARYKDNGNMPPMFWMHNPSEVPGVWKEMKEDKKGLYVLGELVDTVLGNDMRTLLQKKAVRGLSVGYIPTTVDYDKEGNRLLREIDLWEASLVSLAMNPLAKVEAVKSRLSREGEYVPTERELEECLRDSGCSRKTAQTMIARIFDPETSGGIPGDHRRDSGVVDDEESCVLESIDKTISFLMRESLTRYR